VDSGGALSCVLDVWKFSVTLHDPPPVGAGQQLAMRHRPWSTVIDIVVLILLYQLVHHHRHEQTDDQTKKSHGHQVYEVDGHHFKSLFGRPLVLR
jgi:hypothetical protein